MKAPICAVCLKSDGLLCPADERKVQEGVVSELDVKIARLLYKMLGDADVEFKRAVEAGDLIVIVVGKGDVPIVVGKGGKNVKALTRELGKRIKVVEEISEESVDELKKLATDLFYPAGVFGVNVVYRPGGERYYKILLMGKDRKGLPEKVEVLEDILSQIAGHEVRISFI